MATESIETFHWADGRERLAALADEARFRLDPKRLTFEGQAQSDESALTVVPPPVIPLPIELREAAEDDSAAAFARRRGAQSQGSDLATFLAHYPTQLPKQCVILAQAGAVAIAMFERGEPLGTKAFKRYVVRGNGRAQPAFLASKGKSRYGSRLRLQNAKRMIEETNRRLTGFWDEHGAPDQILVGVPTKLWAEHFLSPVKPPFEKSTPITRVPLDFPVPTTSVLLRTYRSLEFGVIRRRRAQ